MQKIRFSELAKVRVGSGNNAINISILNWLELILNGINPQQMLPVGVWPKNRIERGGNGIPEYPIPSRFDFLRSLGPIQEIPGISFGRRYNYRAFLIKDKVLVENIGYGNAIYVFRADYNWRELIKETKWQNWNSTNPGFIVRVYHQGSWQQIVIDIINNRYYPVSPGVRTSFINRWLNFHQDRVREFNMVEL